jgi:hypothetical protein
VCQPAVLQTQPIMAKHRRLSSWLLFIVLYMAYLVTSQDATTFQNAGLTTNDTGDGPSPYGTGFAPDVVTIDTDWDDYFPDYEGTSPPHLDDTDGGPEPTDPDPDNSTYSIDRRSQLSGAINLRPRKGPFRRDLKPFFLRVMPLGASVTQGVASTDGNGYRKWLREELRYQGWPVNMVGSKQDGTMRDRVSLSS